MDSGVESEAQFSAFFGAGAEAINGYAAILRGRGLTWGLLGPREGERVWARHIMNSVACSPVIPADATVVDVGSGAGLPGLPLAILRPDLRMTLLEPLARRANFLELAVEELDLADRVRVIRGRAEEHRERYGVVTSRAVAPLPKLLPWCAGLLAPSGRVLALKGESAETEVAAAAASLKKLRLRASVHRLAVPVVGDVTWVVEARRL